jgi:hypothetical protein
MLDYVGLGKVRTVWDRFRHTGTGWDMFGLMFLASILGRRMRFCQYVVSIVLVTYGLDLKEAYFDAGVGF